MNAGATLLRDGLLMRIRALFLRLFSGLSYATAASFAMFLAWALQDLVPRLQVLSGAEVLQQLGAEIWASTVIAYPNVLLFVAVTNLAPRVGWQRQAWLLLTAATMTAHCTFNYSRWSFGHPSLQDVVYSMGQAMTVVLVCAFRSSARTAATDLARDEIGAAALDADLTRARLQLMRAQIEPHFLFNTLATVRALARSDRAASVEMIGSLIRYLSEALPKIRQEESLLADELRLVEAYLRIHRIRMGSRLTFELPAIGGLESVRIPTMILLTLVENALKHGINPSVDGGFIRVSADRVRSALVLRVSDSGQGMTTTEGHGVGLANIRRRLSMLYGDRAILSLSPAASRGVVATVSIPLPSPA